MPGQHRTPHPNWLGAGGRASQMATVRVRCYYVELRSYSQIPQDLRAAQLTLGVLCLLLGEKTVQRTKISRG